MELSGYSLQLSEMRTQTVFPHELATLKDVLLLSPHGFFCLKKQLPHENLWSQLRSYRKQWTPVNLPTIDDPINFIPNERSEKMNKNAKILAVNERATNADKRVELAKRQQQAAQSQKQKRQEKDTNHHKFVIGGLVTKYFPTLLSIELGSKGAPSAELAQVESFLAVLAADQELVDKLKARAAQMVTDEADSVSSPAAKNAECVNGHAANE